MSRQMKDTHSEWGFVTWLCMVSWSSASNLGAVDLLALLNQNPVLPLSSAVNTRGSALVPTPDCEL